MLEICLIYDRLVVTNLPYLWTSYLFGPWLFSRTRKKEHLYGWTHGPAYLLSSTKQTLGSSAGIEGFVSPGMQGLQSRCLRSSRWCRACGVPFLRSAVQAWQDNPNFPLQDQASEPLFSKPYLCYRSVGFRSMTSYNTLCIGMMSWHCIIKNSLVHFRSASEYISSSTKKCKLYIPGSAPQEFTMPTVLWLWKTQFLDGDGYLDCQLDRVEKSLGDWQSTFLGVFKG